MEQWGGGLAKFNMLSRSFRDLTDSCFKSAWTQFFDNKGHTFGYSTTISTEKNCDEPGLLGDLVKPLFTKRFYFIFLSFLVYLFLVFLLYFSFSYFLFFYNCSLFNFCLFVYLFFVIFIYIYPFLLLFYYFFIFSFSSVLFLFSLTLCFSFSFSSSNRHQKGSSVFALLLNKFILKKIKITWIPWL